uniref:O-antigen ligase-related domain-containing protein n=1 Tax=Magnetococcus massalia (strain MO-1) TaxID=451514 RepID=A0A1S7LJC4_MAGMO|nr:membrane protein of unknown function [Candidatus Magnetococcus massalia]
MIRKNMSNNLGLFYLRMLLLSTFISCVPLLRILGLNVSLQFIGWLVPLAVSLIFIFKLKRKRVFFPLQLWIPWGGVLIFGLIDSYEFGFQRTVMSLTPLVVGVVSSMFVYDDRFKKEFDKSIKYFTIVLVLYFMYKTRLYTLTFLPFSQLSAQVMTISLLVAYYFTRFSLGFKIPVLLSLVLVVMPLAALTRMGMIATASVFLISFTPIKLHYRIAIIIISILVTISVFYTDRIQRSMFFSGSGSVADLSLNNVNLATSGRSYMWGIIIDEFHKSTVHRDAKWFGNGANATGDLLKQYGMRLTHPHNDWLRLLYDYGYVGVMLYVGTILFQWKYLVNKARLARETFPRLLFYASAAAFAPYVLYMFSDNVWIYGAYFGNLHFFMIGVACSMNYNSKMTVNRSF